MFSLDGFKSSLDSARMVAKKLKAKKTQAMKKLKHFFGQKLKQPE